MSTRSAADSPARPSRAEASAPRRNLYGRGRRRALRPARRQALERLLPGRALDGVGTEGDGGKLDLSALRGGCRTCWLEIGFGNGEHLLAQAKAHPDILMVGAEPYTAGVAALLKALGEHGPANLRIHPGDGRDLLDALPDESVERCFVLYPDPWPKRRHAARRIVCAETLDSMARVMPSGGELRVASDVPIMVRHALHALLGHSEFSWTARRPADWRNPWPDWTGTRYEAKALAEGRIPVYLTFLRE